MPRKKYNVTEPDLFFVNDYIAGKLSRSNKGWMTLDNAVELKTQWKHVDSSSAEALNAFLEANIKKKEWNCLKVSIRAKRARSTKQDLVNITLTKEAHKYLSALSKHKKNTLSQTIIDKMKKEFLSISKK